MTGSTSQYHRWRIEPMLGAVAVDRGDLELDRVSDDRADQLRSYPECDYLAVGLRRPTPASPPPAW